MSKAFVSHAQGRKQAKKASSGLVLGDGTSGGVSALGRGFLGSSLEVTGQNISKL